MNGKSVLSWIQNYTSILKRLRSSIENRAKSFCLTQFFPNLFNDETFPQVGASLVTQMVKNLPCRRPGFDPWVGNTPPEKEMATDFSILAWRIPWTEESGGLQSMGSQRVGHSWATNTSPRNTNTADTRVWKSLVYSVKVGRQQAYKHQW